MNTFKKLTIVTVIAISALGATVNAAAQQPRRSACAHYTGKLSELIAENMFVRPCKFVYANKGLVAFIGLAAAIAVYKDAPDAAPFSEKNMEHYSKALHALWPMAQQAGIKIFHGVNKLRYHCEGIPALLLGDQSVLGKLGLFFTGKEWSLR